MAYKPSAESRAAGGRAWNKVKGGSRSIVFDGPDTPAKRDKQQEWGDNSDAMALTRNDYLRGKSDGEKGLDKASDSDQYLMGYAIGEYDKANK